MEMEVVVPVPAAAVDFNFDSACSSPYMTAPSSPQRFGNYFSAPASPTRVSSFYRELNDFSCATNSSSSPSSSIPFNWEERPGTPKARNGSKDGKEERDDQDDDGDFEFNFSGHLERSPLHADELFDGGKIRPLKPPPGYDSSWSNVSSPRSPRSPRTGQKKKDFDPFQAALEETRRRAERKEEKPLIPPQRGRGRSFNPSFPTSANSIRKGSRSLSPLRVSDIMFEQEENNPLGQNANSITSATSNNTKSSYLSSLLSAVSFSRGTKKWKLKDLLLFRSASEGRAPRSKEDSFTKYAVLSKKEMMEDVKNSSFRSTDSSVGTSRRTVSAHEMHYTVNRAVSEELRRKTFLPYKQGLLGCLGFNPAASAHEISTRVGSLTRG